MANSSSDEWFVGEDGSLAMGEPTTLLTYHSSLNTLLVATKDFKVRVIDVTSGSVLQSSDLSANKSAEGIQCAYMSTQDKLLFSNGYAVSVRNDLNGVMLLDTALQTPVAQTEDIVKIELPLPDASQLFKSLMSAELAGVDHVEDVLRELETEIENTQQATKHNHKVAKWATVCLKLPYFTLKTVCSSLLVELKRLHQNVPALSVASAVSDRLLYLLHNNLENAYNTADRSLMYSEAARRETFAKWPHMNYKWALPDPMAKAGFYHQPNSTGDDRAMCFTCNVCLVCWEPTDEPWSEHERHSSACPFVKGEFTQNVPFSVTHATEPAHPHGDNKTDKIACISTSANCDMFATSTLHGNVVVWDCSGILKKHVQFHIEPASPAVSCCTSSIFTLSSSLTSLPDPPPAAAPPPVPKGLPPGPPPSLGSVHTNMNGPHIAENCIGMMDVDLSDSSASSPESDESQTSVIDSVAWTTQPPPGGHQGVKGMSNGPMQLPDMDCNTVDMDTGSDSEEHESLIHEASAPDLIPNQHTGPSAVNNGSSSTAKQNQDAWKKSLGIDPNLEIPLTIVDSLPDVHPAERHRPSRDVIVSSLCVLGAPSVATVTPSDQPPRVQPSLVSGVLIRMENNGQSASSRTSWSSTGNEVHALNQVNQALSEEMPPEIIPEDPTSSPSSPAINEGTNFVPFILVHNIAKMVKPEMSKPTKEAGGAKPNLGKNLKDMMKKDIAPKMWGPPGLPAEKVNKAEEDKAVKSTLSSSSMTVIPGSFLVGKDSQDTLSSTSSHSTIHTIETLSSLASSKEGSVLQCVPLPAQVGNNHYVHSITPTADGQFIVVITAPKITNRKINVVQGCDSEETSDETELDPEIEKREDNEEDEEEGCVASQGGCILIYRVKQEAGWVTLEDLPCRTCVLTSLSDAVISVAMLPAEIGGGSELSKILANIEKRESGVATSPSISSNNCVASSSIRGCMVITTYSGHAKIVELDSLGTMATIPPPEGDKIINTTFCTGIDRLCCCGEQGRLYFYMVGPRPLHMDDLALGLEPVGWLSKLGAGTQATEDTPDSATVCAEATPDALLAQQPLTPSVLTSLHDLTQFENLVPRFCATVPPCWNEIQQEQQQRRHPQHLQQQGDSTQHTRSWRLQQDSTSWDEHLFELVIPKSCCVGHVDIKFSLHPLCVNPPVIQVTLLRQSMTKLGRVLGNDGDTRTDSNPSSPVRKDVDAKIDFRIPSRTTSITDEDKVDQSGEPVAGCSASAAPPSQSEGIKMEPLASNPVKTREFLEKHGAEILCGPVELGDCVDMSGHGGIITLTSPELLKIKSRSFLVHFKAIPGTGQDKPKKSSKSDGKSGHKESKDKDRASTSSSKPIKKSSSKKHKDLSGLPYLSSQDRLTALTSKQKLDSIRGCDWLQEVSVTVRRCQPVNIPRERLQRVLMLESSTLHQRLLQLVCELSDDDTDPGEGPRGPPTDGPSSAPPGQLVDREQMRILALDILVWICAVQTHATDKTREPISVLPATEAYLKPLVQSCYLESGRTIARQCTRFIMALIEYTKSVEANPSLAPDFSYSLLYALLDCLPSVAVARSAGALHWFFVVLNRVKAMDIGVTGTKCVEMLAMAAKAYSDRNNPLHALLKSRFGLYGHPLEPDLFDVDPPGLGKATSQPSMTFANILKSNNNNNNNGGGLGGGVNGSSTAASTPGGSCDEVDIQDYLLLTSSDKNGSSSPAATKSQSDQISSHVFGLLEVEPLHFTCHAASDGTRLERLDSGPTGPISGSTSGVAGLSGTINFGGENMPPGAPNTMSSLSAATEHQLSVLHQKHIQLLKLQQQKQKLEQKLAETSKGQMAGGGSTSVYNNPELFPPTPKNTPFFMTPPVTPPNESYHNIYVGGPGGVPDPGKPPTGKDKGGDSKPSQMKSSFFWSQTQHLFQPMPAQALVIERLHSGARRFVVLDFGKPVLLTDIIVPGCGDLQSLSIDVWTQGEDIDGQRLVVAGDIGMRSLVLNDLSPPPLCRYLKITTIGRHGGNASRSKIPLGSFYGHSFVFPSPPPTTISHPLAPSSSQQASDEAHPLPDQQSQVMSQLGLCMSLLEDIQCRYSLACNRLASLLSLVQVPHNSVDHTLYYLKQGKKSEDDKRVLQAYQDCMSLQLQLNLAQWAIERLQGMVGIRPSSLVANSGPQVLLKQAHTDKLRVLTEFLLDTLVSMTCLKATVPQIVGSLYASFTPQVCESLFRHLCLTGTKKIQIHTGVLLVRLCGSQPWWGEFLGGTLQQYFTSEQLLVYPRDRVFLVLCALSQKALAGSNAGQVLESLVYMLGRLLSPLLTNSRRGQHATRAGPGIVDQGLVSWMLLFLSRSLDNTSALTDDAAEKGAAGGKDKDKDNGNGVSTRWDFLQGESSFQKKSGSSHSRKAYHNRQRRGYWNPKYQLQMQHLNKDMFSHHQANKALSTVYASPKPEAYKLEALNKTHSIIKKQYKQYSSKHFKDLLNIRRTTGEYLRKLAKEDAPANGSDADLGDADGDVTLTLARDKCVPVVRGLVALLLSTDFTCHVDLFIVSCKVLARITSITRPVMMLSEIISQSELDQLVLLTCNAQYNHGNINWGGSWAGHTIACLLQDILEGERLYGLGADGVMDDDVSASVVTETDDSLQNSTTLPTIDEDNSTATTEPEISQSLENNNNNLTAGLDQSKSSPDEMLPDNSDLQMLLMNMEEGGVGKFSQMIQNKAPSSLMEFLSGSAGEMFPAMQSLLNEHKGGLKFGNKKLSQPYGVKLTAALPHGVSTAMDARLEHGVQLPIELKLKVILSLETDGIQSALTAPLPPLPPNMIQAMSAASTSHHATDDEQLSEASLYTSLNQQVVPSSEMLSTCFNALFCHRVNLDTLLLLWLTLNEDTTQDDNGLAVFDSTRVPTIPLNEAAVSSLLQSLVHAPHVSIQTWILAFQCLTLLANLKYSPASGATASASTRRQGDDGSSGQGQDRWLAHVIMADQNMMTVLLKFLMGSATHGLGIVSQQNSQAGPTAVKAFHEVLVRLQLRCAEDHENMLRELLLRLIYQLATERGAFSLGIGPLDAQCSLLDHMLEQSYQNVDINNAISVIESVSLLVHQHILSQSMVTCRSSTESAVNAKSCFGGLFAGVLRSGNTRSLSGDANRDILMCNLLSLVNLLVQAPIPQRAPRRSTIASISVTDETLNEGAAASASAATVALDSPMTDFSKISQSLGGNAAILTSTPVFPMSDDEKVAETDEQKTEHAVPAPKPPAALAREQRQSCNHFTDVRNPDIERKDPALADIVLGHQHIMFHFLQALGLCNSNTIATILGSSGAINDSFINLDPMSVGDGMFQILCTMNSKCTDLALIMRPLYHYLSAQVPTGLPVTVCQLSEPLLWFVLSVLDCEKAFRTFLDMGGVEVVCQNLVRSSQQVISTSPGLVSTIMQFLGSGKRGSAAKKFSTEVESGGETLQNFAPLGTITSSSASAGPADVLIQGITPHRRARSAAWSFNFYPHEAWVDLTINLPCAVLLREVHVQPHLASLATCPSAVTLEVSHDGLTHTPVTTPLVTSGLNSIKVLLHKPEVVLTVTIRLHKPRDSSTIGLSQIRVLGTTAFGDSGGYKAANVNGSGEDYVSRTSMGWLRLLHHCLTQCDSVHDLVATAAAPVQPLLMTCTSLLLTTGANLYVNNIEAVLLKLGLHSADMGLGLIDHLLRNVQMGSAERAVGLGRSTAVANESTVDLLYQLGVSQDDSSAIRVQAMTDWLGDSARVALQRIHGGDTTQGLLRDGYPGLPRTGLAVDLPSPAPAHVHCVAAVLWESRERRVNYNLPGIVSRELLSSMYEWSMVLCPDSALKKAVDAVICSICYIHPEYFTTLLEWMGIILSVDFNDRSFLTDDVKDGQNQQQQQAETAMTDDLKATTSRNAASAAPTTAADYPMMLQDFGHMILDQSHLSTLAIACQSPAALRRLLDTGFLAVLCQGLYEFCLREMSRWGEPVILAQMFNEGSGRGSSNSSSGPTSPRAAGQPRGGVRQKDSLDNGQDKSMKVFGDLVAPVLRFLAEISREVEVKDWLGGAEGCIFWPVLLRLLCSAPVPVQSVDPSCTTRAMTVQQRSAIETATIDFFSCVLTCHHGNQLQFANILCDVIRGQGSTVDEYGYRSSPLCGFMRCLFLQVLLEDEKLWVCLKASSQLYKGHSNALTALVQHPRYGAGHKYRVVQVSLQGTIGEVMGKVSASGRLKKQSPKKDSILKPKIGLSPKKKQHLQKTMSGHIPKMMSLDESELDIDPDYDQYGQLLPEYTPSLASQTAQLLEEKGDKTLGDDWLIDSGEMGIEVMVEQISAAAGLQAKEKRDKSSTKSPSQPPRPPSRRGHCASDSLGAMNIPVLQLYHKLLPGQPLPEDLSLSQLFTMLRERGLPEGQAAVDFTLMFKSKPLSSAGASSKPDSQAQREAAHHASLAASDNHQIPASVLLDTASLPTALQVFASVGGLALLAEHLPLLYPEVTRQGAPMDGDKTGPGGTGQDWVTVENTEDIYEEIYEPIPPSQSGLSSKQPLSVLPSIPPHSLVAFGLFLRLPGYAEVLLKEKRKAQCLLRLVLGVTDDGEGGHILTSPIASLLPTLPFNVLKSLFDSTPLSTDDGVLLRRMTLEIGAVHLVLACLSVLSHHAPRQTIPGIHQEIILAATQAASVIGTTSTPPSPPKPTTEDRSQLYWAKGTGFGTGSTASYWDAEQALIRQRCEEEHVTCLLQVLASFINPGGEVPDKFDRADYSDSDSETIPLPGTLPELLTQSCLVPAMCSYLRNDSVLDMARHVPLYRSLLELLRGLALCTPLVPLLLPLDKDEDTAASVSSLLDKMKTCVDTYASRLKTNKKSKPAREDEESEGLALLIPDIQTTAAVVDATVRRTRAKSAEQELCEDAVDSGLQGASKVDHSLEDRYVATMRELQFDTYEMVIDEDAKLEFTLPHHYESNVKAAGEVANASRARRLAQEAVTLSTSLPLSAGSSVFVRCDEERLDVMKVLITGPADTPYANGCFEFDVYFPQDYPNTPPQINLETTGNHTVRFNPNLYNDGKVCLSILNTWHGRPEEKWNAQTSSFLQVLVSIQSLILVSEPYFNEPGYERSRGTASGASCSKEYDANIRQATVKWAMLEMLRNPPACFKEVVECHFWLKQHEILRQIEAWITDLEANSNDKRVGRTITHSCVALKRHFAQLKEEFAKMKPPSSLAEELTAPPVIAAAAAAAMPTTSNTGVTSSQSHQSGSSGLSTTALTMTKSQTFTADSGIKAIEPAMPPEAVGNSGAGPTMSPLDIVEVVAMQNEADFGSFSSESDSDDLDNLDSQTQSDDMLGL